MDIAYNQHSPYSRRHDRSSTNLNHLSLAPLTSKLPISDHEESSYHTSYIEGRSAPTTPSILSRSSSRVSARKPINLSLPKSKSSTQLMPRPQARSGTTTPGHMTPGRSKLRHGIIKDDLSISTKDRNDSDWLLRAGALMSSSARESKGQSWLVSRASSTSLTAQRDEEEEDLEREREQASRRASRRGSITGGAFDADDEFSPITTRRSLSFGPATGGNSRPMSHFGSRANSRRGSRPMIHAPMGEETKGYFDQDFTIEGLPAEPDFVDVEEEGYEDADQAKKDEAMVRKLARASSLGLGGWVEKMLGWSLFAVEEDGDETEFETVDEKAEDSELSSRTPSRRNFDGTAELPPEARMPPLNPNEAGAWNDAAWLLSVASKVLL